MVKRRVHTHHGHPTTFLQGSCGLSARRCGSRACAVTSWIGGTSSTWSSCPCTWQPSCSGSSWLGWPTCTAVMTPREPCATISPRLVSDSDSAWGHYLLPCLPRPHLQPHSTCPDRSEWRTEDPQFLAEVLFAVTSMLSFTRLAYILPAHESLGTLQISIGKMIDDMIRCVCPALHTPAQASSGRVRDSLVPHTRPHSGFVLCFVLRSDHGGVRGT